MKVLLVDDTKTLTTLIKVYLMGWSMEFHEAQDGGAAWKMAQALRPDLVISDIKMPVMDGFQLCAAIRSDRILGATPVILLTQLEDQASRDKGRRAGATAFLTKPVAVEDLRQIVAKVLKLETA